MTSVTAFRKRLSRYSPLHFDAARAELAETATPPELWGFQSSEERSGRQFAIYRDFQTIVWSLTRSPRSEAGFCDAKSAHRRKYGGLKALHGRAEAAGNQLGKIWIVCRVGVGPSTVRLQMMSPRQRVWWPVSVRQW